MVQFSVLLYSSVLLCCSLLFILLCSSSCYVCVLDCIYCTLTLPLGVNQIAVNKYLSVLLAVKWPGLEADPSPTSSADVKTARRCTVTSS